MRTQSSEPPAYDMWLTAFKLKGLQRLLAKYSITNGPEPSKTSKKEHEVRDHVDQGLKAVAPLPQLTQLSKSFPL